MRPGAFQQFRQSGENRWRIASRCRRLSDGKSDWARQMHTINRRYEDAMIAIVQEGLQDGTFRSDASARVLANAIIGMVNWSHRWFTSQREHDAVEVDAQDLAPVGE